MAIRFDAGGDVLVVTANLPSITSWTIMGWFKISVDTNTNSTFIKFGIIAGGINAYILWTAADGVTLDLYNDEVSVAGSTLTVGVWNHLAVTVAGTGAGQALAYLNGVLDITASGDTGPAAEEIVIGDFFAPGDSPLNGCAQDIFVYSAALTQAEIAQQMRQRFPIRTLDLNRWAPCMTAADAMTVYAGTGGNWSIGGTLTTEDGPPVPWSTDEDNFFTPPSVIAGSSYVQRERGIRGLNRGLSVGVV